MADEKDNNDGNKQGCKCYLSSSQVYPRIAGLIVALEPLCPSLQLIVDTPVQAYQ